MEPKKIIHFLYVPFTGLGLYSGFRGNRWLRNRIKVFKQFVVPSLQAQTNQNFTLWVSWRYEERHNPYVKELVDYLENIKEFKTVHTFHGVCFWDDKYDDKEARNRLITSLHGSIGELLEIIGEVDYVYMTIQPSDDLYVKGVVGGIQTCFEKLPAFQALGFTKGYVMDYKTRELAEYNPNTIPPFFTIKFPRDTFCDPLAHAEYTGPYKSHEYIGDKLKFGRIQERQFIVGIHGFNISTVFDHPYRGDSIVGEKKDQIFRDFGISNVSKLVLPFSVRDVFFRMLPYKAKRKLRYWATEKRWILRPFFAIIYNILRA